jgi:hypothetical protein
MATRKKSELLPFTTCSIFSLRYIYTLRDYEEEGIEEEDSASPTSARLRNRFLPLSQTSARINPSLRDNDETQLPVEIYTTSPRMELVLYGKLYSESTHML